MCGILFSSLPLVSRKNFLKNLGLLKHRGPDASPGYVEIGHVKLGIID